MSEVENLKKEISETKAAISTKIETLESHAQQALSLTHQIEEHPFLCLGLSLGAGLIVGTQLPKSRKILEPIALEILGVVTAELGKKYLTPQ